MLYEVITVAPSDRLRATPSDDAVDQQALGATVRPGKALEIGMTSIQLTPEAKQVV